MTTEEICSELFNSVYGETLVYGAALAIRQIAGKTGKTVDEVIDDIISERIAKSMEENNKNELKDFSLSNIKVE